MREYSLRICIHVLAKNSKLLLYHNLKKGQIDYSSRIKITVFYFYLTEKDNPIQDPLYLFPSNTTCNVEFTYPLLHSFLHMLLQRRSTDGQSREVWLFHWKNILSPKYLWREVFGLIFTSFLRSLRPSWERGIMLPLAA